MAKRAPRLQFTEEERASPELAPAIQKADKQIKKLEKAEAKVPKKEVKQRVVDSDGKITTRLSFEERSRPPSSATRRRFPVTRCCTVFTGKCSRAMTAITPVWMPPIR